MVYIPLVDPSGGAMLGIHPVEMRVMAEASVFKSNRNQAIRLPKQPALPEGVRKVEIYRRGHALVVVPVGRRWDDFFDEPGVSEDYVAERAQPSMQERDVF